MLSYIMNNLHLSLSLSLSLSLECVYTYTFYNLFISTLNNIKMRNVALETSFKYTNKY